MAKPVPRLSPTDLARVLEIAWADPDPLNRLLFSHGLTEGQVIQLMKRELSSPAYKLWSQQKLKQPGGKPVPRGGTKGLNAGVFSRSASKTGGR
jgi:uncharacterized protein (TIGR03643 family)